MAYTKHALIRHRTIDKCLQNRYRRWTLDNLIEACASALSEIEGKEIAVSKRTIQLDIQLLRGDKLGYNAPIVVYDKKYYTYSEPNFSLTNVPLTTKDMQALAGSVTVLKQFSGSPLFSELGGIVQRLEDKLLTENKNQPAVIHLDKSKHLKGLEHFDILYQAILKKTCVRVLYQAFAARSAGELTLHPYLLKEYDNRWFLIGRAEGKTGITTLALDRIQNIVADHTLDYDEQGFDGDKYYSDTIGVNVLSDVELEPIVLWIDRHNAPYLLTRPLHKSQEVLKTNWDNSIVIQIKVHQNDELERLILGFGEGVKVKAPAEFRRRIKWKLHLARELYE